MTRHIKTTMIFTVAFSFILFSYLSARAQPIGIMSPQPKKPQQGVLSSEKARFVFGQVSDSSKDKFMLDTSTGRLWRIAESGSVGIYLTPVSYRIAEGKYSDFPETEEGSASKGAGIK